MPTTWRDRVDALVGGRRHIVLLAVGVAAVAIVGLALWARGAPATVAPPATANQMDTAAVALPSPTPSSVAPGAVLVHVAGAVRRPGLYEFPPGARIADAIEAARGVKPGVDLDVLNLAEPLVDGQKIEVARRGPASPTLSSGTTTSSIPGATTSSATTPSAPINLNTADQAALESIPGVGPVTATAILEYRTQIGAFTSIDQLLDVSGIGPATLESIRPYVTL